MTVYVKASPLNRVKVMVCPTTTTVSGHQVAGNIGEPRWQRFHDRAKAAQVGRGDRHHQLPARFTGSGGKERVALAIVVGSGVTRHRWARRRFGGRLQPLPSTATSDRSRSFTICHPRTVQQHRRRIRYPAILGTVTRVREVGSEPKKAKHRITRVINWVRAGGYSNINRSPETYVNPSGSSFIHVLKNSSAIRW